MAGMSEADALLEIAEAIREFTANIGLIAVLFLFFKKMGGQK